MSRNIRRYEVTLIGKATSPLLMHYDNIEWADEMTAWKDNPANKDKSKAGDDRTPAWRWLGCLYHDNNVLCIPQENIMRCLMEAGAMVPVPKGKNGKTFKEQTQSGMQCAETDWPLLLGGKQIPVEPIMALKNEDSYVSNRKAVQAMGFDLFAKRAKVQTSKHIRVRPIFRGWQATGHLIVWDEAITDGVLDDLFFYAGNRKGIGDWRPGSKTPGQFGMFDATVKRVS